MFVTTVIKRAGTRELGLELCPCLPSELPAASSRTHSKCPICPQDPLVSKLLLWN